jgi:hypothetical protein
MNAKLQLIVHADDLLCQEVNAVNNNVNIPLKSRKIIYI